MFHIKLLISFILIYTISLTAFAEELIIPTHVPAIKVATGEPGKNVGPGIFLEEGAGLSFDISVFSMGHEVGNGGFAFDKSIIVLQAAADELIEQIEQTDYPMFDEFPERREILLEVLPFDKLEQYLLLSAHNNGNPLWLGYDIAPRKVMVFQLFYMAFWRYKDKDFTETVQEIKQLLLHEASHIWGFNQDQAREFSQDCLNYLNNPVPAFARADGQVVLDIVHVVLSEPKEFEISATVSSEVASHPELGNLFNWCSVDLGAGPAHCYLKVTDSQGNHFTMPIIFSDVNSIIVDTSELDPQGAYEMHLYEAYSEARSNAFYLKLNGTSLPIYSTSTSSDTLRIMPISQYTCLDRRGESLDGYDWFMKTARLHFLFPQNDRPPTISPNNDSFICHNTEDGSTDSPFYNRFEELSGFFALWDSADPRFFDLDQDGRLDINNQIDIKLAAMGESSYDPYIFRDFAWSTYPGSHTFSPNLVRLGYYMQPWAKVVDGSWVGHCPTRENYENPSEVLFNIIGDIVGKVDTEAIYMGARESIMILDNDGSSPSIDNDYIIIRESLLNRIGFYNEGEISHEVDALSLAEKEIMFYWPPDISDPYVRKSNQLLYTITDPGMMWEAPSDFRVDKRIGCVPEVPLMINDSLFSPPAS